MSSLILRTATRLLLPVLLLFSIFLLMRGHNEPGGGFVGGLVAATAFSLYAIAYDVDAARRALALDPHTLIGIGLLAAIASGIAALAVGEPFLTSFWTELHVAGLGKLAIGTPLLFDIGVYLVVFGVTLLIVLSMAEE